MRAIVSRAEAAGLAWLLSCHQGVGTGATGPGSLTGLVVFATTSVVSTTHTATATCPAGNPNVTGGGFTGVISGGNQFTQESYPSASNAWKVTINADAGGTWIVYAVCSK